MCVVRCPMGLFPSDTCILWSDSIGQSLPGQQGLQGHYFRVGCPEDVMFHSPLPFNFWFNRERSWLEIFLYVFPIQGEFPIASGAMYFLVTAILKNFKYKYVY